MAQSAMEYKRALDAVEHFIAADIASKDGSALPAPATAAEDIFQEFQLCREAFESPVFGPPLESTRAGPQLLENQPSAPALDGTALALTGSSLQHSTSDVADFDFTGERAPSRSVPAASLQGVVSRRGVQRSKRRRTQVIRTGFIASDTVGLSFGAHGTPLSEQM